MAWKISKNDQCIFYKQQLVHKKSFSSRLIKKFLVSGSENFLNQPDIVIIQFKMRPHLRRDRRDQMMSLPHLKNKRYILGMILIFLLVIQIGVAIGVDSMKTKIVFSTQHELIVMGFEDNHVWRVLKEISLPNKSDIALHPAWMPDGEGVIFEYNSYSEKISSYFAVISIDNTKVTKLRGALFEKGENYSYPMWSPNGKCLAFIDHKNSQIINGNKRTTNKAESINRLLVFDTNSLNHKMSEQISLKKAPFSWSSDNKKIAYVSYDGRISVYDIETDTTLNLDKGGYPVFHPITNRIYYIAPDKFLYSIGMDNNGRQKVNTEDWSWFQLVGISKDGNNLFFIGGGSRLSTEYKNIGVFNLISHKQRIISQKFAIINGASLYE
jgi:WD40 repeat protein